MENTPEKHLDERTIALINRIEEKMAQHGMSDRKLSLLATGKPDTIRDLKRRGAWPSSLKMQQIAFHLGTTTQWLMGETEKPAPPLREAPAAVEETRRIYRGHDLPKDIPVRGTAEGAKLQFRQNGHIADIESFDVDGSETVDWLKRPPSLSGKKDIYGLYIVGWSMHPRYDDGDPLVIDPNHRISIGDDVIVQIATPDDEGHRISRVLCKTLVRRTADYIELEQYSPRETFRIPHRQVAAIHRIIPRREIYGI